MPGKLFFYFLLLFFSLHGFAQGDPYNDAQKLRSEKHFTEAISLCSTKLGKLNKADPSYSRLLALRADIYREIGDFASGIKDFQELIKLDPKNVRYYVALAYMYGSLTEYDDCLSILYTALKIDPQNIYIYNNLSYYSGQKGNYLDAIKYADEGLRFVKDPIWKGNLLNNRGYGYIIAKKYPEALKDINQAIQSSPDNSFAYCYRALANIQLKRFETVCDDLNTSKKLGATNLVAELINQYCKN